MAGSAVVAPGATALAPARRRARPRGAPDRVRRGPGDPASDPPYLRSTDASLAAGGKPFF
ncbi:hypothetical protein HBB16_04260 [Pseudonocardia sp. MCCB 268]|nr:hypothetical protein [Pseudonocardia cytotoxica]